MNDCEKLNYPYGVSRLKEAIKKIDVEKIWTALRQSYPLVENIIYDVKDCTYNVFGKALYNGFDFVECEWEKPVKGPMFFVSYQVTHWSIREEALISGIEFTCEAGHKFDKKDSK